MVNDALNIVIYTGLAALLVFSELWCQKIIDFDLYVIWIELGRLYKDTYMANVQKTFFADFNYVAKFLLGAKIVKGRSV